MLRSYALSPNTLRKILRNSFLRFLGNVTISFLVFGLYLALFNHPVKWSFAGPVVGVIAAAYLLIMFFNYRQQLRILFSARYELDGSSVIYRQLQKEQLRIMRADVTAVQERKNGLWIQTVDSRVSMLVPYGLARDGDADMRRTLDLWVGVSPRDREKRDPVIRPVVIGGVGGLLVLLFANNFWILLGIVVLIILYSIWIERRYGQAYDRYPGAMRSYNMAFSFLIFVILMKSCLIYFSMLGNH